MTEERLRMKLFDELTRPGARVHKPAERYTGPVQPEMREQLLQAKRVWVDEALHTRVDSKPVTVDLRRDFGELRLPFDYMWIEWISTAFAADDPESGTSISCGMECLVLRSDLATSVLDKGEKFVPGISKYDFIVTPWLFNITDQIPVELQNVILFEFTDDGELVGVSAREATKQGWVPCPEKNFQDASEIMDTLGHRTGPVAISTLIEMIWNGLVAVGFMNCKNVDLQRVERSVKQPKKSRRQRPPKSDYHIIKLPKAAYAHSGATGDSNGQVALHKVRGHFKTYTVEAPLLGKHTGTYWWANHARGNPEHGEITSDYIVTTPPE